MNQRIFSMICFWMILSCSFRTVQPLLVFPDLNTHQLVSTIDAFRRATVPGDIPTATAIGISEAIAGAIGGLASRGAANAIGDKKIDTVKTKVTSTGAFFGSRGLILVLCQLLGFPRTLSVPLSSIAATVISEATKAFGRNAENVNPSEKLQTPEVIGDIVRWLTYDAFEDTYLTNEDYDWLTDTSLSASFGAMGAVAGGIIKDMLVHFEEIQSPSQIRLAKLFGNRGIQGSLDHYGQLMLEGAVLFGCYKLFVDIESKTIPKELNKKFVFEQFIEMIEEDVAKIDQLTF